MTLAWLLGSLFVAQTPGIGKSEVIQPFRSGVVKAEIYDTRKAQPQIQKAWPWKGPIIEAPYHAGANAFGVGKPSTVIVPPARSEDRQVWAMSSTGFAGIAQTRYTPPDPTIAVGPNHIVETVNASIAFYSKTGTLEFAVDLDDRGNPGFFEPVGAGSFVVDPKVLYDAEAGRFVVMAIEVYQPNSAWIDIAVSDDDNPHGIWYKYRTTAVVPVGTANYWVDYPSFGFDRDAYYTGGNLFRLNGSGSGTAGILFRVFRKAPMLSGDPVIFTDLRYGNSFSAQAGHHQGNNIAGYYASVGSTSSMRLYAIRNPASSPTLVTTTVSIPTFSAPSGNSVPNLGGGTVDPLDGRVFNVYWRNGRLYVGHPVVVNSAVKARWYQFETNDWPNSGTPTLAQVGTVDPGSGIYTFYPALAENVLGDVGLVVARSSATEYVSMQMTSRTVLDPIGTMGPLIQARIGDRSASGRWGDYYAIGVDPSDYTTFWAVGQYSDQAVNGWATWIQSLEVGDKILPATIQVTQGSLVTGSVGNLHRNDGAYVEVQARRPTSVAEASVEVVVSGTAPADDPRALQFVLEAATSGTPTLERIEFWNFDTNRWETVAERNGTASDSVQTASVTSNAGRFIANGTLEVRARLGFHDRGVTFVSWGSRYDLGYWRMLR
jgi:hypothetical protein